MKRPYVIALFVAIALLVAVVVVINMPRKKKVTPPPAGDAGTNDNVNSKVQSTVVLKTATASNGTTSTSTVNVDATASIPQAVIDSIYTAVTSPWIVRQNAALYSSLMALNDGSFLKGYFYWETVYEPSEGESLAAAIAGLNNIFNSDFAAVQAQLAARFAQFNLS